MIPVHISFNRVRDADMGDYWKRMCCMTHALKYAIKITGQYREDRSESKHPEI